LSPTTCSSFTDDAGFQVRVTPPTPAVTVTDAVAVTLFPAELVAVSV
jgi:hypothetical protein